MKKSSVRYIIVFSAIVIAFALGIWVGNYSNAEQTYSLNFDKVVSYDSVCIGSGDTIWSIAEDRMEVSDEASLQTYVEKIKYVNDMASDEIHAGKYIIVPNFEVYR